MSMEEMPKKENKFNYDFRHRYLLKYWDPEDPADSAEMEEYELLYFTNPKEIEKLKRTEQRLCYEYVLGILPEIDKESLERLLPISEEITNQIEEAKKLSKEELEKRLAELKKED